MNKLIIMQHDVDEKRIYVTLVSANWEWCEPSQ